MGIDEKPLAKGQRYATMVGDLEHGHVIELAEGRSKESLLRCLGRFSINELSEVKAIAMDMWEAYASLLRAIVDDADDKIVRPIPHHRPHQRRRGQSPTSREQAVARRW